MRAFEQLPARPELVMARVTYELLRPVPLGELYLEAEVVRAGRRVQLLEGSIHTPDGIEVVRARGLQVQLADSSAQVAAIAPPPQGPEHGAEDEPDADAFKAPDRPTFTRDAIEIRFVEGRFGNGPATAWFRLRVPIVPDEAPSPLQRLAAAGDFGNGISAELSLDEYVFINPDLTLYMDRPPEGEWIGLEARTIIVPDGVGVAESVLYDSRGRVGRALQSLLVARR
jgi:hypothetical protein